MYMYVPLHSGRGKRYNQEWTALSNLRDCKECETVAFVVIDIIILKCKVATILKLNMMEG